MNCKIRSFNLDRAMAFGYKPTITQRVIHLRSKPHVHTELQFSERYNNISFSATLMNDDDGARFAGIEYSHEADRWDTVIVPMTDKQEDKVFNKALYMAGCIAHYCEDGKFYNIENVSDNIKYDLIGQLCHLTNLKIWKPNPLKTWCTKAVNTAISEGRLDFYALLVDLGNVGELRPDQLDMMARWYFRGE